MLMDLHNHTTFSYDGSNSPEQIIENAINHGFHAVAITDHQFTIKNRLGEYIDRILRCKEKYASKIKVYAGLEIGTCPRPTDIFASDTKELDFVLFESLDRAKATDLYEFLPWRHMFECPVGLAHCDIFKMSEDYNLDMLNLLKKENIFWEINTSGNYNYYYDFLTNEKKRQAVKAAGIGVSVGSDTHALFEYRKEQIVNANILVRELGLPLPFKMD